MSNNSPADEPENAANEAKAAPANEAKAAERAIPVDDVDWQKLWIATQRKPWRSLAIIPSSAAIETLSIAKTLAAIGQRHLGRQIDAIDARSVPLSRIEETKNAVAARSRRNEFVIVALGPVADSAASLALATSADAALLAVLLGHTSMDVAEKIIEDIGADRFLGSFVLHRGRF